MIDNAEVYLNQSWSAVVRRWDCDTEEWVWRRES